MLEDSGGISENSFDLFGTDTKKGKPGSSGKLSSGSGTATSSDTGSVISDDEDSVKEEERKIVRSILFAGAGAGVFAFLGWGFGKLANKFKSNDIDDIAGDALQGTDQVVSGAVQQSAVDTATSQAVDAATHVTSELAMQGGEQLAFNASMTASSGNMSSFVGAPITANPGLAGPQ